MKCVLAEVVKSIKIVAELTNNDNKQSKRQILKFGRQL